MVTGLVAGWRRGLIELRQSFTNAGELWSHAFWPGVCLAVLFFMRDAPIGQTGLLLGTVVLPSMIGMNVAVNGILGMSPLLATDREDGTLLRAKAIPNGMLGYLVGKVVLVAGGLLVDLAIVMVPGLFLVAGITVDAGTLIWVLLLGLVAVLPLGAVLGSLVASQQGQALIMLPVLGLVAISGIFYPIAALPGWLQGIAQVFPVYWLGLGMRAAMLPDGAAAVELGGSWRSWETAAVLGGWAVLGLLVAPIVLRRMARRECGSALAKRRELALPHGR